MYVAVIKWSRSPLHNNMATRVFYHRIKSTEALWKKQDSKGKLYKDHWKDYTQFNITPWSLGILSHGYNRNALSSCLGDQAKKYSRCYPFSSVKTKAIFKVIGCFTNSGDEISFLKSKSFLHSYWWNDYFSFIKTFYRVLSIHYFLCQFSKLV